MEAALASGVLKVAGDKLVSLITSEFASITDVKKHLYELEGKRQDISRWLPVVGDRATEGGTPLQWVKDLRNVAYDIEDLLYEVHLEAEKHRIHSDSDEQPIAGCFCAKPKSFLFRCKVARKIEEIKLKYEKIVKQASDANKIRNNLQMDDPVPRRNRTAGELSMLSNVDDSKIPKRDQEKDKIVSMILESNEGGDGCIGIVSIIGLGGSGKTTLAKHICHDKMIIEHFNDAIFWVHVSQEFDVKKLICKLFQAVTKQKSDLHAEEHMFTEISNKLRSKKFLLVLDDAWCREKHDWEQFIVHLKNSPPGSKILLTTRDLKVAESVNSRNPFELELLTEDESWSLFLTSSKWVEKDLSSEYIQVGKEILNRCSGVPLAIRTIGGILCEKKEISIWRAIRGSDLWNVNSIEENVFSSLKLSFIHLSDELKQCFTFCSIFPKGYEIYKDRLIAQWVAHGFINAMNGVHPEIIGRGYFDSLLKVGFLQDPYEHWPSEQLVCKMHDLIHDLARLILQDEVVTYNMTANCTQRCRYLSLTSCADKVNRGSFGIGKVHAVFVSDSNPTFDKPVKKSSSVRSVVLDYTNNTLFPQFILKFEYIGYLEIHNLSCSKFPEALSGCWNLQSLHFISCNSLVTLPKSIGKLKKLRTLELIFANDLESLPQSIGDCRDLQSLHLHYCGKVSEIPSTICKIRNLRALHISNCSSLEQLPSEFTGEFSNLRTINLAYSQVTMLPQWVTTIATLKCINLRYCQELVELPEGVGNLKSLEVLDVEGCRKLGCMPSGIGQLTLLEKLGLFVVGSAEDDASISELGDLGKLRGGMQIRNLKYLKDPCDAEKACLKRKNKIQYLELYWSLSQAEVDLASDVEQQQAVLSALEPPSQIQNLEINGYRGLCFPWWMMEQNDSSCCEGITLEQTIPCQFLSLTKLRLCQILNLKHMRGLLKFPSLKSLELWEMTNLEELWTTTSGLEILEEEIRAEDCFPVLSELSIRCCPKLSTVKPYFPPSLEKMRLDKCNLLLLSSGNFSHLLPPPANQFTSPSSLHSDVPHLRVLRLERMTRPSSSGWEFLQHCTELETLCINGCDDLTQLPESTRSLTSLQELCIYNCSTLCALPEWLGELCSLRELNVSGTPMISSLPQSIGHLTSLTRLEIGGCDNLKLLPDAIQHLASLEYLQLAYCHALAMLPECIGQLSALQRLYIRCCSTLECLPQSILHLTALQGLFIYNCPALARRYKQGVGSDWHLVSHVPHVTIRED